VLRHLPRVAPVCGGRVSAGATSVKLNAS